MPFGLWREKLKGGKSSGKDNDFADTLGCQRDAQVGPRSNQPELFLEARLLQLGCPTLGTLGKGRILMNRQ